MSEKASKVIPALSRFGWLKSKSFWLLVLWLTGGIVLFAKYRNLIYGFPIIIFVWLFLCVAWFGIPRWKWWGIPITLLLTILACAPLSIVYLKYESQETDRALKEFVLSTIAGKSSSKFSIDGDDLPTMSADFTADFTIVSRDNFWMEYEQVIRFTNGSEYHVVIVQDSPGHWEVRAQRVKPPSQTVEVTTASPSSTNTVPPSSTPTAVPSSTPSPTLTPTRTPKPTWTHFPTRTPTPTPTPTMLPEAKREIIERNLAIEGCEPPCWGGITPGKTSWQDALDLWRELVAEVNGKSDFTYAILDLSEQYPDYLDHFEIWSKDETVTGIYIETSLSDGTGTYTGAVSTYLAHFQLADVLARYGTPSQVYGKGYVDVYYDTLWVEYADVGVLFGYTVDTVEDAATTLICPIAEGTPRMILSFQAPGAVFHTLRDYFQAINMYDVDEYWKVIENVSPEVFATTFREPASPNCLRVPRSVSEFFTPLLPEDFDPIFRPKEDARLLELLETNGGCELPCWWGITPGVTRIEEAQALFARYGKAMEFWRLNDDTLLYNVGLFARHEPLPLDYVVRQSFYVQDGVISSIYVSGEPPLLETVGDGPYPPARMREEVAVLTQSRHLMQDWQHYALTPTLKLLGVPSEILVDYTRPDCYDGYQLALVYDDLGIVAHYGSKTQSQDGKILICPALGSTTYFGFTLASPGAKLNRQMQNCYSACIPVSLEEAAGIQPDAFYQTYINPDATNCFEVREDLAVPCP